MVEFMYMVLLFYLLLMICCSALSTKPLSAADYLIRSPKKQGIVHSGLHTKPLLSRITGGTAKGRVVNSPPVHLRPMMSKVREAVFASLQNIGVFNSAGVRVLDLFSGSGSVGLEALSRGASHATFIDRSSACLATTLRTAKELGFSDKCDFMSTDAMQYLAQGSKPSETYRKRNGNSAERGNTETFDLVSITPPYDEVTYEHILHTLADSPLVSTDSLVLIEYPTDMGRRKQSGGSEKGKGGRTRSRGKGEGDDDDDEDDVSRVGGGDHFEYEGEGEDEDGITSGGSDIAAAASLNRHQSSRSSSNSSSSSSSNNNNGSDSDSGAFTALTSLPYSLANGRFIGLRNRKYGRTGIAIYACEPSPKLLELCKLEEFATGDEDGQFRKGKRPRS